ncbi:MAG: hypothetical protein GW795_09755 [Cyanobacteria bacterium]|nr:hypothetical protein [Cyanobacteria bacterium CG_2015-16_32_12]NCO78632.1 hypothetical protein [Cyanobacteria bacterium CG_2015-22_32_23]NCQ04476.1 hypothetical protein [Cyanobacteria bacterium CG_2015-09_32_10]NCQ42156.1 hypothetical protein [Cyanobacteria bacterium CG_2015-04_32_10]NCS86139.1 hypothetical protein [Cyanobacteria bacterium CG_2015-02_32_10]
MSTIIETDLKEVLTQINTKLDNLAENVNQMKVDIATLKEGQTTINKRLDTIETSLTKRIDGIDTPLNTLIAVAFTALLGIIAKLIFVK